MIDAGVADLASTLRKPPRDQILHSTCDHVIFTQAVNSNSQLLSQSFLEVLEHHPSQPR